MMSGSSKGQFPAKNKNRHVGSCNENQTTPGDCFPDERASCAAQVLAPASQTGKPPSSQHGLFIRLAIDETGLPSAFANCDNKLRFVPCLHRRFSADDALPLTCLSVDACYPSPCFVSATIHFETIADSKTLAIDASLCTPQTLVQLLTHNGL